MSFDLTDSRSQPEVGFKSCSEVCCCVFVTRILGIYVCNSLQFMKVVERGSMAVFRMVMVSYVHRTVRSEGDNDFPLRDTGLCGIFFFFGWPRYN